MRFRTVVVAAVILVLAASGALAAMSIAEDARSEAAQTTMERSDSLAVEPDLRQKLVSDDDHDPTGYGDTITVTYNGTEWTAGEDYEYYQSSGEIEFLRDEPDEATIDYRYEVPEDQVQDEQIQTLTVGFTDIALLATGLAFVVLLLFLGGYVARKMGVVGGGGYSSNR